MMNPFVHPGGFVSALWPTLVLLGCSAGINTTVGAAGLDLAPQSGARYQCGPTTLASVIAYYGGAVAEATIAAWAGPPRRFLVHKNASLISVLPPADTASKAPRTI